MINIKVILNQLAMPKPNKAPKLMSIKKKLKQLVEDVKSPDKDISETAWKKLKFLYECVSSDDYKKSDKDKILKLITPVIRKYAQYDNDGVELSTDYIAEDKGLIP